jgi:predicted FMN-binding regulatory protein PaiB
MFHRLKLNYSRTIADLRKQLQMSKEMPQQMNLQPMQQQYNPATFMSKMMEDMSKMQMEIQRLNMQQHFEPSNQRNKNQH